MLCTKYLMVQSLHEILNSKKKKGLVDWLIYWLTVGSKALYIVIISFIYILSATQFNCYMGIMIIESWKVKRLTQETVVSKSRVFQVFFSYHGTCICIINYVDLSVNYDQLDGTNAQLDCFLSVLRCFHKQYANQQRSRWTFNLKLQ